MSVPKIYAGFNYSEFVASAKPMIESRLSTRAPPEKLSFTDRGDTSSSVYSLHVCSTRWTGGISGDESTGSHTRSQIASYPPAARQVSFPVL